MSDQVLIWIIVAVVVIVALFFGRRLLVKFGGTEIETGRGGTAQSMVAKGPGSKIENASQTAGPGGGAAQGMTAKSGGVLKDAHQKEGQEGK